MKTPQLPEADLRAILDANNVTDGTRDGHVCVVAIRGYYLDSMGKRGANDRRIWDDAHFFVWPDGIARWQANTDPNGYREGAGKGAGKGMACLRPGIHRYGIGRHKGRAAFRQVEPFTVIRDGDPPYPDCGWHAINLHSGGNVSTSSLGCQTVPASTWQTYRQMLYGLLEQCRNPLRRNDHKQRVRSFDYILIEETERRAGNLVVSTRYL
jgi:lysozyme